MPDPLELEEQISNVEQFVALLPPKVRKKARGILSQGGDRSVQLLTQVIAKERAKRRTRAKVTALPGSLLLVGSLVVAVRSGVLSGLSAALGLSGLPLLAFTLLTRLPTRLEKAAQEVLSQSEETLSIGPDLAGLRSLNPAHRTRAKENLITLLPQMSPENFQQLTLSQRGCLYGTLNYAKRHTDLDLHVSVLGALSRAGDKSCLGVVYLLATGDTGSDIAAVLRKAARNCIGHLLARLDFGPLENLAEHIVSIDVQVRAEKADLRVYAASMLTLRRLLPQLTTSNYGSILSANHRNQLYRLLMVYASSGSSHFRYGRRELLLEIVRTAERVGDAGALDVLSAFSCTTMAASDEEIYAAVCQALSALEG